MKVLITGFDPFGGETIGGAEIVRREIPTVFGGSLELLDREIREHEPEILISVGQAGGRSCITVERIAINLQDARIPDNAGAQPSEEPVEPAFPAPFPTVRELLCATA